MERKLFNYKRSKYLFLALSFILVTSLAFFLINGYLANLLELDQSIEMEGLKRSITITMLSSFVILYIIVVTIISKLFKSFDEGLFLIKSRLEGLAQGDLTRKIEKEGSKEFKDIYIAFNSLVDQQSNLITKILEESENLSLYSEIQAASTEEGDAAIETTNDLISNISASIQEISASSEEVTSFAQESTSLTQTGKVNMEGTVDRMEAISKQVNNTVFLVEKLNNNAEEIGSMIELITNVADQTNLLALNAAIEAARAGEQGHGFTVVAEEIRELAEETTKATINVKDLINNTRNNSKKVIEAIKEVEVKTKEGQEITQETNQVFIEIEKATEETATQIEQIAYTAQDLAQSSEGLLEAAQDIGSMSKEINDSSKGLDQRVNSLKKHLGKFTLEDMVNGNQWSNKFEVGVEKIDEQHKGIFDQANYLLEAYKEQKGESEINKVLDWLVDYIEEHFDDEEIIQQEYKYPDYENHKKIHDGFKARVQEVVDDYNRSANITALMKLNKMVTGWLIEHIKREDQKLAAHIKSYNKS
ncbi:bacteriohemerythrin [Halonatronum saccharophilum]|uniref:bacteriohemerythrin n=1 Tax=Halonatronum saccharophilum TaxID=150060 RepID=UPI000488C37D|nr:bacteriohemerythrin [Halonatronum saccharophilum]